MKSPRLVSSLLLSSLLLTSGCGILLPKKVELFQRKVRAVPVYADSAEENQRQAAQRIVVEADAARVAALQSHASTNIIAPLVAAEQVAGALSTSLGPPSKPYRYSSDSLSNRLIRNRAELNAAIESYADKVQKDVGKSIEGTGLVRIGYFSMIGGLLLLGALVWFGLKVYGISNPIVGGVTSVIGRISSSILHKGFTQVVAGGEAFKAMLDKSNLDEKTAAYVKQMFVTAQKTAQDADVKAVVTNITKSPDSTPPPTN